MRLRDRDQLDVARSAPSLRSGLRDLLANAFEVFRDQAHCRGVCVKRLFTDFDAWHKHRYTELLLEVARWGRRWRSKIAPLRLSADEAPSGLSSAGALVDTQDMNITKNIGMLLLAIYLIAVGILTLTGLGIGIITGVLALLAGIFILIGR
jgi:hypothetical protein